MTSIKKAMYLRRAMPARYVLTSRSVRFFWLRVYGWNTDKVVRLIEVLDDSLRK